MEELVHKMLCVHFSLNYSEFFLRLKQRQGILRGVVCDTPQIPLGSTFSN